ncbi:hypothetical protein FAES_3056 [Fibrella aestuarina BUZ 2]|uniref:Uncharacterized protein n=1 Tax=Fibrella aestuarina BUZ 2 TaxID=1166018 RepID=I0KAB2_9BACT|nr:hypothetical protein FAES_3056 [Fibrella aestuarina BUZ 2]
MCLNGLFLRKGQKTHTTYPDVPQRLFRYVTLTSYDYRAKTTYLKTMYKRLTGNEIAFFS